MKQYRIALSVLAFTAIFIMLVAPATATENRLYFVADNSTVSGYGDYMDVDIYTDINESNPAASTQFNIEYDPNCVENYPSFAPATDWPGGVTYSNGPGICYFTTTVGLNPAISGHIHVGTLTLRSNITCGGSFLNFTAASYSGGVLPETDNGTFLCDDPSNPVMTVTTMVWNGSSWVDSLPPRGAEYLGTDVRFNTTVTAGCLDIFNVVANGTLDASLAYNNSAVPTEDSNTTRTANWTIGMLSAGTSQSIEFNATIVGYGTSATVAVTGTIPGLGSIVVNGSGSASVTTLPPAGVGVNKTVWNGSAWVELINGAVIGDTYRFRVEVNNTGSPGMDLCEIIVWDELPAGLSYAGNAKLWDHHGIEHDINPPDFNYGWIIDNWVPGECLQPIHQKLVIEYDVTVTNYGLSCNNVSAEANCSAAASWVYGNDSACIDVPKPDLNVTPNGGIKVNLEVPYLADYAFGPVDHPDKRTQPNSISAEVQECNGVDVVVPFDVTIVVTNSTTSAVVATCTTTLQSLAGGTNVTVWCNDSWYPTAGWNYTINVTADPADAIPETDETNNTLLRDITAHNHGLKGGSWQSADSNITTLQYHNGTVNLLYSVGDSKSTGSTDLQAAQGIYLTNWTAGDFSIPVAGSTIEKVRLYVYYNWEKTADRNVTDYFTLDFNGYVLPQDAVYSDVKAPDLPSCGYGCADPIRKYAYPYGMVAYDVTHKFLVNNDNTANLTTDSDIWSNKKVGMTGMLLVVVYENSAEPERIIWINEGFDMLKAGEYNYDHEYVGVNTEEATTHAPFAGGYPILTGGMANLVTVVNHPTRGGTLDQGQALYFNGMLLDEAYNVWTKETSTLEIGINTADVTALLQPTDNIAAIQSVDDPEPAGVGIGGDWFEASNAFLIVNKAKPMMSAEPDSDECYDVGEQFDVLVNLTPLGVPLMGAQFDLQFNASALKAETVTYGPFLEGEGSVFVSHSDIDNANGVVSFAAARQGTSVGVTGPGTFAIVHFTAETQGIISELNLTNALASDNATPVNTYELVTHNGTAEICTNAPPVAVAKSNFTYNNIAEKGLSKAYFIGTDSYDPDGTLTNCRWWVDDGSSLVGEIAEHLFVVPMYWQGGSDGYYALANVTLTVTDDGIPLMDANDTMEVIVWIGGDATNDGRVNIADGVTFGMQFGKSGANIGDPDKLCWEGNPEGDKADLNNDGRVNIGDAMLLGTCWGHIAW